MSYEKNRPAISVCVCIGACARANVCVCERAWACVGVRLNVTVCVRMCVWVACACVCVSVCVADVMCDDTFQMIAAEGEHSASRAMKEAADVISDSSAALQLRYLQTLTRISAEKNSTIIFPLPADLLSRLCNVFSRK